MKFEIEVPDPEINEAIRRGGMGALTSAKMKQLILETQIAKIAAIIDTMDVSKLVQMEIDATMKEVIQGAVKGRIRRIIRPIIEQEIAKLRGEAALTAELSAPPEDKP